MAKAPAKKPETETDTAPSKAAVKKTTAKAKTTAPKATEKPAAAPKKPALAKTKTATPKTAATNVKPATVKAEKPVAAAKTTSKAKTAPAKETAPATKAAAAKDTASKAEKTSKPATTKSSPVKTDKAKDETAVKAKAAPSKTKPRAAAPSSKAAPAKEKPAAKAKTETKNSKTVEAASTKVEKAVVEKPWLASYPTVVQPEIGPLEDSSIGDLMVRSCKKFSDRPAFTSMGKTLSFTQLEEASRHFAAFLQARGLQKGARIAIMMPNVLQYPVALMAALRSGYVVVNVNPLYTPRELEHQLKDSGAEAIVILENFAATLQTVVKNTSVKHVVVASMGDLLGLKGLLVNLVVRRVRKMVPAWSLPGHIAFNDAMKEGRSKTFHKVETAPSDVAFLQYTGGTTGVSKGATLLHSNVLANVEQNALWVESAFVKKPRPRSLVYVCALPLYHIYALTVNALMGMQQGAQNILIANPRDIPGFVKELQKYPFNVFPGLNTLFNALLNNEDFQKLDFKPLLLTFGGGMAVQKPVADRWQKLTGIIISEGYGLSETSPVATANRFDADEFSGTIGLPIPSTEVVIRDEDGKDLPLGEVGEICIRGPQIMAGYWNRPDETAKVMTADGYFKSGDMGFMDDRGYVKIVDRKKDMILVSGFNVYPNEIEEVIAMHPGVLEVAAIGVPDQKSGEVPKVFIVKKDQSLTEQDIIEFCKDKLTNYKRPRHVEFRAELPKTNVGKILRRELR